MAVAAAAAWQQPRQSHGTTGGGAGARKSAQAACALPEELPGARLFLEARAALPAPAPAARARARARARAHGHCACSQLRVPRRPGARIPKRRMHVAPRSMHAQLLLDLSKRRMLRLIYT